MSCSDTTATRQLQNPATPQATKRSVCFHESDRSATGRRQTIVFVVTSVVNNNMARHSRLRALRHKRIILAVVLLLRERRPPTVKRRHRVWVHEILQRRFQQGTYHNLIQELQLYDSKFVEYFRLNREQFAQVLYLIEGDLRKMCRSRETICPRQRLAVCIRFLATGESFRSLSFQFRLGVATVAKIVAEVCRVLWERLSPGHLAAPDDQDDWRLIAANFDHKWNFPHCLGALDGKHIVLKAPFNSGSLFRNYKGTFSIVLMALVDANLRFVCVDVGAYGRNSDAGVFGRSNFGKAVLNNTFNFPTDAPLSDAACLGPLPYVIIGDEAFPLRHNLLRPFPGRTGRLAVTQQHYNYRLCRARRVVENAFGVLASRWRVYHTKIDVQPPLAKQIVKATLVLHNLMQAQTTPAQVTSLLQEVAGVRINGLENLQRTGNRATASAIEVRDKFARYFVEQPLPWQERHVMRGTIGAD